MRNVIARMNCTESDFTLGLVSEFEDHTFAKVSEQSDEFILKAQGDKPVSDHTYLVGPNTGSQDTNEYEKLKREVLELLQIKLDEKRYKSIFQKCITLREEAKNAHKHFTSSKILNRKKNKIIKFKKQL